MRQKPREVILENVRMVFRNFSGAAGRFGTEGDRKFSVLLGHEEAEAMKADGWNVKYLKPREEGEAPQPHLPVAVEYRKGRPPRVVLITSRGKTSLDETMVSLLDWADIEKVDMILNPHVWGPINGNTGVKAYLKSIYVTIREDPLEMKYIDVPDSGQSAMIMPDDFEPRGAIQARSEILSIERGEETPFL